VLNFQEAKFEFCVGEPKQLPTSDCFEIVFSGRSNVGKSSFINKVLNRKSLARVSSKPGKTVTINFYRLGHLRLVDMPGYGYAKVPFSEKIRWSSLVETYFNSDRKIVLVLQIIDFRHTPSKQDMDMINYLTIRKIPFVIIATKSDKLNKSERMQREAALKEELAKFGDIEVVIFSSVTGEGVDKVRKIMDEI
jgi:ribosome biogenesis GTP-binding protein YsxC/EngB